MNRGKVEFVQFTTLSDDEWRRYGIKIDKICGETKDGSGTPYDPRLGVLDNKSKCATCGFGVEDCPGHFGFIELPEPIVNPEFTSVVHKILSCICIFCSEIKLSNETMKFKNLVTTNSSGGDGLLKRIKKECDKVSECEQCGEVLPQIVLKDQEFYSKYKDLSEPFDTRKILNIFMKITNETMFLLGFNRNLPKNPVFSNSTTSYMQQHMHQIRPESFIFTVLPVIPPCIRPWATKGDEKRDDYLTEKYNMILKTIKKLEAEKEGIQIKYKGRGRKSDKFTENDDKKIEKDLKKNVRGLFDSSKETNTTGRKHKAMRERMNGKEGHMNNISGKRVDFTARTVIVSGGSLVPVGYIGVSDYIANGETYPEMVTKWNYEFYLKEIESDNVTKIVRGDKIIDVKTCKKLRWRNIDKLKVGDVVERKMRNKDQVVINRQPTLRIESMMGCKTMILNDEYVFRISLPITSPLGADFDGDEINIHVPQSQGARIECEEIMAVKNHIVTRQSNSPVIGCVQNTLISFYLLTNIFPNKKTEEKITKAKFFDILTFINLEFDIIELAKRFHKIYPDSIDDFGNGDYRFKDKVRGKIVVSCILPENLCFERRTNINERYPIVLIQNGIVMPESGPLEKKIIGRTGNSIVHMLWKYYSPKTCETFLNRCKNLNYIYLQTRGFSMGISDCVATSLDLIESSLKEAIDKCDIISESNKTSIEKEGEINSILNKAMEIAPKLARTSMNKGENNALVIMKKCGAKGSDMNNGQISGFVGQQNIDGKRIPCSLNEGARALPCFQEGDLRPEARGFVKNSFLKGLTYYEAWFHAITGRRGIIDTGMKTGETGYAEKKMVQFLVDLKVHHDFSVRGVNNEIYQFVYGGDAMCANKIHFVNGLDFPFFVDLKFIADSLNISKSKKRKLTKREKIEFIESLNFSSIKTLCTGKLNKNMRIILFHLLQNIQISESKIKLFFERVRDILDDSKCDYGEMVGLIAACSMGEVTTQLTLNIHRAVGVADKDITLGVPRLKELLGATKRPSSRSCFVVLKPNIIEKDKKIQKLKKQYHNRQNTKQNDEQLDNEILLKTEEIGNKLKEVTLKDIVDTYEMKYICTNTNDDEKTKTTPINILTYEEYEPEFWVELHNSILGEPEIKPQSWVLVLTFNLKKLYRYKISLSKVAKIIEKFGKKVFYCVPSPDCLFKIEIYFDFETLDEYTDKFLKKNKKSLLNTTNEKLCGESNFRYFIVRDSVIESLKSLHIQGIQTVKSVGPKYSSKKWILQTKGAPKSGPSNNLMLLGSNLLNILNNKYVDHTETVSDDMWEIFGVLGIEAARSFIVDSIRQILFFDGTYIDVRHIRLLADAMTRKGTISGVNRDGIGREVGTFAKGMFEKVVDNFREASTFGEHDPMNSLSSSIFMGTIPKCGTGVVDVRDVATLPVRRKF
jgi:DNA-directed RNA polymerase beta' subunit